MTQTCIRKQHIYKVQQHSYYEVHRPQPNSSYNSSMKLQTNHSPASLLSPLDPPVFKMALVKSCSAAAL
jgi:hypothetical protein